MKASCRPMFVVSFLPSVIRGLALTACLLALTPAFAGWSFDTGLSPEKARDLLAAPGSPAAPAGSWLRVRDLPSSLVHDANGAEVEPWSGAKPSASLAERRAALAALRAHGYRLVAMVRWESASWPGGVRPDQSFRRLPIDLRNAAARCRQLAEAYGDLIDYWEIDNEPDISYVEENPETYAAFLKACYLAFKNAAVSGKREGVGVRSELLPPAASLLPAAIHSKVLMAAFALPPGPYFDAWLANDGLRYTDGFNYHYYGYAEDFTGVYRQFEAAVEQGPAPAAANEAIFETRLYPSNAGWQTQQHSLFAGEEGDAGSNRALLQSRPRSSEEPALEARGRWLVSPGTTVRETADGWEFTVSAPAPGPQRPAMAELPLPAGWSTGEGTRLAFQYRAAAPDDRGQTTEDGLKRQIDRPAVPVAENIAPSAISYPPAEISGLRSQVSGFPAARTRELPIFLTEYGYGLLNADARATAAGREAQRGWFTTVKTQVDQLGIEGAMAFLLVPYIEIGTEFGLLISPSSEMESGKSVGVSVGSGPLPPAAYPLPRSAAKLPSFGRFTASPALAGLLEAGSRAFKPRTWTITASAAPTAIMIDFVAGPGLTMEKSNCGYRLQADSATGGLVLYNLGSEAVTGELALEGSLWKLTGGVSLTVLELEPGERCEIPVEIRPVETARYAPQVVKARFRQRELSDEEKLRVAGAMHSSPAKPAGQEPASPSASPIQVSGFKFQVSPFEVYLRTSNGNLYQTWPRLQARESWQWYVEPFASFTPAFFGRAHLPTALSANTPASLVFFFRPDRYPVTYHVRHASVVSLEPRQAAPVSGKR